MPFELHPQQNGCLECFGDFDYKDTNFQKTTKGKIGEKTKNIFRYLQ